MLPCLYLLFLNIGGLVGVLGSRSGGHSVEVRPELGGLHGLLESHGEDGPVGAIGLELWNVGRVLFNGGGGRHSLGKMCSKVFVVN